MYVCRSQRLHWLKQMFAHQYFSWTGFVGFIYFVSRYTNLQNNGLDNVK